MKYNFELIATNDYIPFRLLLHRPNYVQMHWHEDMEILFVLSGNAQLLRKQERFLLKESDITVINSKEVHSISGDEQCLLLVLQISQSYLEQQYGSMKDLQFICNSSQYDQKHQEEFDTIRQMLAHMMFIYTKQENGYELEMKGMLFRLIAYLVKYFAKERSPADHLTDVKYMDRLMAITEYIQQNYSEPITLTELAEKEYLSVHYLSRFFKKVLGITFSNYLNGVRLEHAMYDLLYTDETITQIAINNGFPNLKSFNKVFHEAYGQSAKQYRSSHKKHAYVHSFQQSTVAPNYLELNQQEAFKALFKYLPKPNEDITYRSQEKWIKKSETVQMNDGSSTKLVHTWKRLTSIGKAKEGLYANVQRQLTQLQKDIGFTHIRFHGIFDDEMMVYQEDESGNPYYQFAYVDQLFDFFLSIGLKPFIELGFMPAKLASSDSTIFIKKSNVSFPRSLNRWTGLVKAFVEHCIERYGYDEVAKWYFEVWNEPDVSAFWDGTKEQYFELHHATYQVIKQYSQLKMGGPSLLSPTILRDRWLQDYLEYCKKNNCIPDFISIHSYPYDQVFHDLLQQHNPHEHFHWNTDELSDYWVMSESSDYLAQVVAKTYQIVADVDIKIEEIHVTEWNSSGNQRDLIHDTCYQSAYIVKNIIDNLDQVDSLCYWTCTDLIEEFTVSDHMFHGGLGLMTMTGVPKAAYYAYQFLALLGHELIKKGNNYCVTRRGQEIQVLVYHYVHTDQLYRLNEVSHINRMDRYGIFEHTDPLQFTLELVSMPTGTYQIRKMTLNRQWGSSFDNWVEMGHPECLYPEDLAYLQAISQPKREVYKMFIDSQFNVKAELSPHEVQLYILKPL
ncbi:GH39 family glycosyl hydrolase [Paenibacillus faecalis]|uniref:GH39 family glycosyl hydrolase n=1 Tax=Paenibacillus faecalis TaxID=2079532 RepID=UPI00131A58E2|nr:helix-turn-helix domain-containing protein [Paenibacillus faecalis]